MSSSRFARQACSIAERIVVRRCNRSQPTVVGGCAPIRQPHNHIAACCRPFFTASLHLKKKGKAAVKSAKGKAAVTIDDDDLSEMLDIGSFHSRMRTACSDFRQLLQRQFSLRTNIDSFDNLPVKIGETIYPLNNVAQIVFKTPYLAVINMSSMPEYVRAAATAVAESGMNLNPQVDGSSVFVAIPKISREHRQKLATNAKLACNDAKNSVRIIYSTACQEMNNAASVKRLSSDALRKGNEWLKAAADSYKDELDKALEEKTAELLS